MERITPFNSQHLEAAWNDRVGSCNITKDIAEYIDVNILQWAERLKNRGER